MSPESSSLTSSAIRLVAASIGAVAGGPLGAAIGGFLGHALSDPTQKLIEKSTEKLIDLGADSLAERLKPSTPSLQNAYREALRQSLAAIHQVHPNDDDNHDDWFENWDLGLSSTNPHDLAPLQPNQLQATNLDNLFRDTMETLDAQGHALRNGSTSIILKTRSIPDTLLAQLTAQLPQHLEPNFRVLIITPAYEQAWKQAEQNFNNWLTVTLNRIDETTQRSDATTQRIERKTDQSAEDIAAIRRMLESSLSTAVQEGRIAPLGQYAKDAEIARLTGELNKLQTELAARKSEPGERTLSDLLSSGDLNAALHLKTEQVEARRAESDKLARDLFELGTIHELRFDFLKALEAYREAWQLKKDPEYGFKFAYIAQRQNHFSKARDVFEVVLKIYIEENDLAGRATTLNNLANLYKDMQLFKEAEAHYNEALSTYYELAEANPQEYLPDVAGMANNLALLYRDTQRIKEAETYYDVALSTYIDLDEATSGGYVPNVAATLNNLAVLYSDTQRIKEAETYYDNALSIRRELAGANPEAYLPDVAMTLNNLALLYSNTQRIKEAEAHYNEALSDYRELARANPEAYVYYVAATLNNLASLYSNTQRIKEAEAHYNEALSDYRELAGANPEVYLPYVALTLNNLASLYNNTHRIKEAEAHLSEALSNYHELAGANPEVYLPYVALALNNLAVLYSDTQRIKEAEAYYKKALSTYRELAGANPEAYLPNVAMTLNNLAVLYGDTQRIKEAEAHYNETLSTYRKLAGANPEAYVSDVAMTLNNLASLYRAQQQIKEAEQSAREAEDILEPLWAANPQLHGDQMAKILWLRAELSQRSGDPNPDACNLARRAIAAAYAPALKQGIQTLIDQLCPDPQNYPQN